MHSFHCCTRTKLREVKGVAKLTDKVHPEDRPKAEADFVSGKTHTLMVTPDQALHVRRHAPRTQLVINYDFPGTLEEYADRAAYTQVGKQGRGQVLSFFSATKAQKALVPGLVQYLGERGQDIPPELEARSAVG